MLIYVNIFVNRNVNNIDNRKNSFVRFGTAKTIKWNYSCPTLHHISKYHVLACAQRSSKYDREVRQIHEFSTGVSWQHA